MSATLQLELNFKQQLQQAQSCPQDVDWQQLCLAFDAAIAQTPLHQQLALAANAILEMAELYALRAETWFEDLRYSSDVEPVFADEVFADLVRQSMSLDLDDLVAEPELYLRSTSGKPDAEDGSVVEYQAKDAALEFVDQLEERTGTEVALGASHEEDVGAWVKAIGKYLEGIEGSVSFAELVTKLGMPVVAVWLGILLGGFGMEQRGGFYDPAIWVG
ncbi:MAG: hypothetical protein HC936_03775 [Leptolyngbyaceae cyanobacterium SU_3_3]|nr:hypothetical protein [Leptolyngbyaceae cyanobacterium SU_3_3]